MNRRTRALMTAAIERFGLDSREDREVLEESAKSLAGETVEDAMSVMEEYMKYYRMGEHKKPKGGYSSTGEKVWGVVSPLRPIQDLGKPDPETEQRMAAFSKYLAKIASVDKNVLRYRKNNIGGFMKTMSEKEAQEHPDHPALLHVCRHLANQYPWTEAEARYFVLCGVVPQAAKISGRLQSAFNKPQGVAAHKFHHQTIQIQVPAWMPSEMVRKAYSILRRQAHGGRDTRRPTERNVVLFEFVLDKAEVKFVSSIEYLARLVLPGTWTELMQEWNEVYGSDHPWHYREASNFARDFGRGQKAVAGSKYALSGVPGQPMTAAEAQASFGRILERLSQPGATLVETTAEEIS